MEKHSSDMFGLSMAKIVREVCTAFLWPLSLAKLLICSHAKVSRFRNDVRMMLLSRYHRLSFYIPRFKAGQFFEFYVRQFESDRRPIKSSIDKGARPVGLSFVDKLTI